MNTLCSSFQERKSIDFNPINKSLLLCTPTYTMIIKSVIFDVVNDITMYTGMTLDGAVITILMHHDGFVIVSEHINESWIFMSNASIN